MSKLETLTRISPARKVVVTASIVFALVLIAFLFWYALQTRAHEYTAAADVTLFNSGKPNTVKCKVETPDGKPLSGLRLKVHNNSGGDGGTTDANGEVVMEMGEPEVDWIDLEDVRVLDRPHAAFLKYPAVTHGLLVKIVVKDPAKLGKAR